VHPLAAEKSASAPLLNTGHHAGGQWLQRPPGGAAHDFFEIDSSVIEQADGHHEVNVKMARKTNPWQGRLMSSGGRLILVNSSLSNVPTYLMGFYHLTNGYHEELDKEGRSSGMGSKTFKYHIAKWGDIAIPKEFGGMGIINTRRMNDCLLVKWIWKIVNNDNSLWCRLLQAKYLKGTDFFSSKYGGGGGAIRSVRSGGVIKRNFAVMCGWTKSLLSYHELYDLWRP
jgi:hypothetical protein